MWKCMKCNGPLNTAGVCLRCTKPEAVPVCWVIAVEEYGQMVVYGPQYRVRESAEQDARLPKMREQKAEVWACYRPQHGDSCSECGHSNRLNGKIVHAPNCKRHET